MTPRKSSKAFGLKDWIDFAILGDYMLWVLVTSGAKGKQPNVGVNWGAGKSTFGLLLTWDGIYAGDWEKVKANTIGAYWHIKPILERPRKTLGVYWDDMQLTVGKDKQHNPDIKELAYFLTTVRPYVKVWVCSAPHRGDLHKDFRELFHIEVIIYKRGFYEVQVLKRFIDWKKPMNVKERMRYRGKGRFQKLPSPIQSWYDRWRDHNIREVAGTLKAFKRSADSVELELGSVTPPEKEILDYVVKEGFVRYETLQRKGLALMTSRLRRRGWLEVDRDRRIQLTADAEELLLA